MVTKDHFEIEAGNFHDAGKAASEIKRILKQHHFSKELIKRISIAAYEAEINIVIHSLGGFVDLLIQEKKIYLQFFDIGPGIENIELAMEEGYSTANEESRLNGFGAGMGLSNIKKSSDQMTMISDPQGTVLKLEFLITAGDQVENS